MIIICTNQTEADRILKECCKFLKGSNLNEQFSCIAAYGQNDDDEILVRIFSFSHLKSMENYFFHIDKWYRRIGYNNSIFVRTYEKSISI